MHGAQPPGIDGGEASPLRHQGGSGYLVGMARSRAPGRLCTAHLADMCDADDGPGTDQRVTTPGEMHGPTLWAPWGEARWRSP